MEIVFGLWADGGAAPDHGGGASGALGAPVVGPAGLLDILETIYGASSPGTALVVRIAAWQTALERADDGNRFWSQSLRVDGWATARTLLDWRDQLIGAGWLADQSWSGSRLSDLAQAETAAGTMPPGLADRLATMIASVDGAVARRIRRLRLIDQRALHPIGWRRLFDRLEALGVAIEEIPVAPAADEATALGRLQRWMQDGILLDGGPDGTVTLATSASAALAGELVAQWFAASPIADPAVLVAQDGDTQLLDLGLCGLGQPRAGRSRRSPHRGSLQLLLLGFKVAWTPFDAHALMELLLFPRSPIAPRASWRLSAALEEAPGRGSSVWQDAWSAIAVAELAPDQDGKDRARAEARVARWRAWADPACADPDEGLSGSQAVAICDQTISWAVARHATEGDPLYLATATLAQDVRRALVALAREHYPRTLVERIIDQALDEGHDNPLARAEAARWRCVPHPGGVWTPTSALLWWNFSSTQEAASVSIWSAPERAELATCDCEPDEPALAAKAASAAWERAVLHAHDRVAFVAAGLDAHADEALHPFAHRIAPALERFADMIHFEDAVAQANLAFAGTELVRVPIMRAALPEPRATWPTPPSFADTVSRRTESATSLESLFSCQLMWALRHVARLRPGRAQAIPDENRLIGNLAHALAREIFKPGAPPVPDAARADAAAMLDDLIDQLAAPLRHPALAAELAFARRRLPEAIAALAELLAENGLVVEATEQQVSADFETLLAMRGAIDLVARDSAGAPVIIDLKWTRSPKSRFDELQSGGAVQLASYGAMLTGADPYRAGYYLLNQRQFATLTSAGLIGRTVDGVRSFPETWDAISASWRLWREAAAAGTIVALGVEGVEDHVPADIAIVRDVRCDRCDYVSLCRVRGLQ